MVKEELEKLIKESIQSLLKERRFQEFKIPVIEVGYPREELYGDYTTNIAFKIGQILQKEPGQIAKDLEVKISNLKTNLIKRTEVKNGFINFFLSPHFFLKEIDIILKEKKKYGSSRIGKRKTVLIDYSSPNIAKPFGIGHLRSTIIGQAIYNIYKFLGFKCIGDNHLGDWGTQYGKLFYAIQKWGNKKKIEKEPIKELNKLYVKFHQEAEKNPQLEEKGRKWFKKLEEGNKQVKRIWQKCVSWSLKEFEKIYQLLGIKIDYCLGESFYQKMLKGVIKEAMKKKIAVKSQGAIIIKYPQEALPPSMLLKSDGATTYLARDLATIKYRLKRWKPSLIIYEVGVEQSLHLKQLFQAVELLGWLNPAPEPSVRYGAGKTKFCHIGHGLYRSKQGKFSTRKGQTIFLEEVLEEAIKRAEEIIEKSGTSRGLSKKEKEEISKMVGIGAIKYNDLSQYYSKDIIFDWEKILNIKGNSGPYLQYTFVRTQSVLKKSNLRRLDLHHFNGRDFKKEELDILRTIYKFPEAVKEAAEKFSPNLICNFAFGLAQKYNLFYQKLAILKAPSESKKQLRLALTASCSQVLENCLFLLGIATPKKM